MLIIFIEKITAELVHDLSGLVHGGMLLRMAFYTETC